MDRELTRAELDELLPLFALDALDGEEHDQVARYVERDDAARAEVESLREAVSFLPPPDVRAPSSLWDGIEGALDVPSGDLTAPPLRLMTTEAPTERTAERSSSGSRRGPRVVALLAAAAIVLAVVLGVQVVRQQYAHRRPGDGGAPRPHGAAGARGARARPTRTLSRSTPCRETAAERS